MTLAPRSLHAIVLAAALVVTGACTDPEPVEEETAADLPEAEVPLATAPAFVRSDLGEMRAAGLLRAGVVVADASDDGALSLGELSVHLQLPVQQVIAERPDQLLPALREGKIDLAAYLLPIEDSGGVAYTRAFAYSMLAQDAEVTPMGWAVRAGAIDLQEGINGCFYQRVLTQHRDASFTGDLGAIRNRRALRVGMLNNGAAYFVYRGQEVGFQYEAASLLAARLAVRLDVVVPERPSDMLVLLTDGRADVVPYSTREGEELPRDVKLSEPFSFADYVVVQRAGEPALNTPADLSGKTIVARRSSTYWPFLEALRQKVPDLQLVEAKEELETEDLIDGVARGDVPLTVSNTILLGIERTYRDDIKGSFVLAQRRPLAYAVRDGEPLLLERLQKFVKQETAKKSFHSLHIKYFESPKRMGEVRAQEAAVSGTISPFDDLARKYGKKYGIDWRLILAQMYQESRFDPKARSWAGARGLMQLMPRTAAEMGFSRLEDPDENIHAGVKYMAKLIDRFEPTIPMRQRVRFALASYNAGYGHVQDARALAKRIGLDPNRWFANVENAIVLLEKRTYYRRAKYGYCRGREPQTYVSHIQTKYDAYSALMPVSPL